MKEEYKSLLQNQCMIDDKNEIWAPKDNHGASGEGCPLSGNQIGLALLSDWLNAFKWTPVLTI